MADEMMQYFTFAVMWMVIYGMLAFGWVHLRDVYRTERGLLFGSFYYGYTVMMVLGLAYTFAAIGLPAAGIDAAFLKPVAVLVGNLTTVIQLAGVVAIITGGVLFIARRFQRSSPPRQSGARPARSAGRAAKRKQGRA